MLLRGSARYSCNAICMGDESACVPVSQLPRRMQGGSEHLWPLEAPGGGIPEVDLVPGARGEALLPSEAPGCTGMWVNQHVGQSYSWGQNRSRSAVAWRGFAHT